MLEIDNTKIVLTVEQMKGYLAKAYSSYIKNKIPFKQFPSVMLWGPPGVGKSQGIREVAKELEAETGKRVVITDVRLLLFNPVDLRGIPTSSEDKKTAVWLKPKFFQMDESEDVVNILFLDEISAAPPSVQAAAYQITLDRVIGEHKLPENCIVIAAGNRVNDKSVAYKMPRALANRLCHIEIESNVKSWRKWAIENNIHSTVIGFIDYNPSALNLEIHNSEENAFSTPRSWEMVSNILKNVSNDIEEVFPLISGCVGSDVAYSFKAWGDIVANIPSVEKIFEGKPTPDLSKPEIIYALLPQMVSYAQKHQIPEKINNSITFAQKLPAEFKSKLFRDYLKVKSLLPILKANNNFDDWMMRNRLEWEDYENDKSKNKSSEE